MKAQLGRPSGLALVFLSTLLAAFLAMGAYTVAQANNHSATRSFSASEVAPGAEITVNITLSEYGEGGSVTETLPEGFSFVSGSIDLNGGGGFDRSMGNQVRVVLVGAGVTSVTYKVTAPDAAGGPHAFSGNFVNFGGESVAVGGAAMVTVAATPPPTPTPEPSAPMLSAESYTATVAEDVEEGDVLTVAPAISATDADSDTLTYSLSGVGSDDFAIDGDGMVTVAKSLNSERTEKYGLTVMVSDGTLYDSATLTIMVTAIPSITLSSHEPGAAVQITIRANAAAAIMPNQDITVDLSGFSVPDTIADAAVQISSYGYNGNPSNVVVSGSKVTMSVPNVKANGDDQMESVMGNYSIRVKQSAGVTNAASGGSKTVKWVENAPNDADEANKEAMVDIDRVIKLSATSGTRGTMTTATFKGFANGSATVNLNGAKLAEVTIADNTGTHEIDTSPAKFKANEDNTITAQDAAGNSQTGDGAVFTISPKAVVDPEESPVSKEVEITLSDWPAENTITEVTIGASDVTPDTAPKTDVDGGAEFKVMVPAGANRGTQTVKVTGTEVDDSTPSATASLSVGVLTLTIQPAMVVPGQQITIEGSGLAPGDVIKRVTIGNQTADVDATANSAGDIVIAVNVPSNEDGDGIGSGKQTVVVKADKKDRDDNSGRVAEGSIEIPKAAISLSPETSRRGTTVNVSGSGFPSGDLVQVKYENNNTFVTVAAGSADASGAVSIDFVVPSYARIGAEHNVEAISVGVFKGVTAKAVHETPGAMVSLSTDRIASGQTITISGMNFPAFATVAVMEIGGVDVRPVPAPATSIDGDFESTVLVPQLELGNQTVSVRVSGTTITAFLEIGTVAVSRDPADVFAGLGDRLVRVWYLDRATQTWSFYDPDPDVAAFNTLSQVSSGQIVTIIVGEGESVEFQGRTLYAGSNPVSLN